VFGAPVAREWLTLLEACEQPRLARLRAAALTCFLGHSVEELCGPQADDLLDTLGSLVRSWAATLHEHGVAALLEAVTADTALPRRLLARTDGERLLTDLRHIAQTLHAASASGHLGPAALIDWLRHRLDEAEVDVGTERSRRLESDAAAVQIITIHRSKGLEFPVVYVPFGWDRFVPDPAVPLLHDGSVRVLDVGGETGEGWKERCARHRAEEAGEDLRLLYVALTRARSQVVTWWVPSTTTASSPVHRLLIGRPAPGTEPAESYPVPPDAAALGALRVLASPELAVEEVGVLPAVTFSPTARGAEQLRAAAFDREIDRAWRRTSYSALTATAGHHGPAVTSEPEEPGVEDEADLELAQSPVGADAIPSPMADLPVGTGFGTLVHAVFEVADLTAPDLLAELTVHSAEQLVHLPVPGLDATTLATALLPAARTPLGPLAGGLRLADIAPRDRLAELNFELPLAGGDETGARRIVLGELAPVLRRHLAGGDPLRDYPAALESAALAGQPLRGYLTGSIDAVLRLPTGAFVVVDYKTNWLGPFGTGEPLTAAHYTPSRLAEAMIGANYPLQALLYGVALHRYLRWRLPAYDPGEHLGGSLYLFMRGMCGPDTPVVDGVPCGVFGWAPPPALVVELSQLLDGGVS
jgi:exodeoxyribonuclease V beta subunit